MHTSAWAEITMIQTYGAFAQINDTKNPETFTQWNCGWKNKNNISMAFFDEKYRGCWEEVRGLSG